MRTLVMLALLLALWNGASSSAQAAIFGTTEVRAQSLAALPKWRHVLERIRKEAPRYRRCGEQGDSCDSRAMLAWQNLLRGLLGADRRTQLRRINRFANRFLYRPDSENYGRSDYWASPGEFLRRGGDCEDYAIFKYVSLRALGMPADRLRLVVLQDTLRNLPHAVLAVYLDSKIYILDNQTDAILTDRRISHYRPYYSVNEKARWAHLLPGTPLVSLRTPKVQPAR